MPNQILTRWRIETTESNNAEELREIKERQEKIEKFVEELGGMAKYVEVTTQVYSAYFSLNHWPNDELFEMIPYTFGFGMEYRNDIYELRIDAPTKEDLAWIMSLECFPHDACLIQYTLSRTNLIRS